MWQEAVAKQESEVKSLKEKIDLGRLTEEKYGLSKKKLKEMEETVKTVVKEKDLLAAKYKAAKEAIKKMQDQLR